MKKIVLYIGLITFLLFTVLGIITDYDGESADVFYYKLSVMSLFSGFVICFAAELVNDKLKKTRSAHIKLWKRLVLYCVVIIVSVFISGVFGGKISREFMDSITPETTAATTTEAIITKSTTVKADKKTETTISETKQKKTTATSTEKIIDTSTKPTIKKEKNTTVKETESTLKATQPIEKDKNYYLNFSEKEFSMLTDILASSFYSFNISDSEKKKLDSNPQIKDALEKIFDYAYKNHFDLDPDYVTAFAEKESVVSKSEKYSELQKKFEIGYQRNFEKDEWMYTIKSYATDPKDEYINDDVLYLDAEGYLNKGVVVYWEEDGKMIPVGEIVDIAYDEEIDDTVYGYGLNVKFYDDPEASGWCDGESFLTSNKKMTGRPVYFISALDTKRSISKQKTDYIGSVIWKSLKNTKLTPGLKIYMGNGYCKTYQFTIKEFSEAQNVLLVEYKSGSVEYKNYNSIINNKTLFVKG